MSRRHRQRGLTLIEVIIAAIVLLTLAGAVMVVGTADMRFLHRSFRETAALRAASSHVERLRAGVLPIRSGDRRATLDEEAREALPGAVAQESVTLLTGRLAEVRVTVRWETGGGGTEEVHLDALVAREIPR